MQRRKFDWVGAKVKAFNCPDDYSTESFRLGVSWLNAKRTDLFLPL
jgi:hypothetical protein